MRPFFTFVCLLAGVVAVTPGALRAQAGVEGVAQRSAAGTLKPGDRILLRFKREPALNDTVEVNERGSAVFAKLGVVDVSAIAIGAIRDTLEAKYAVFLREPEVEVIPLKRVVVNGAVKNPNVYYIRMAATTRDAIALAGGVTTEGNPRKVSIVRDGAKHRVANWEVDQTEAADIRSGDMVVVDRRSWLAQNSLQVASIMLVLASLVISLR